MKHPVADYVTLVFNCDGVVLNSTKVKTEFFYKAAPYPMAKLPLRPWWISTLPTAVYHATKSLTIFLSKSHLAIPSSGIQLGSIQI